MNKNIFNHAILLLAALCLSVGAAFAQSFAYKKAMRYFNEGDYEQAQTLFKKEWDKKPDAALAMGIGNCYRMQNLPHDAAEWYEKVLTYPNYEPTVHMFLFEIELLGNHYDKAREHLQIFRKQPNANQYVMDYLAAVCDTGLVWMEEPMPGTLKNEAALNSSGSDWGLSEGETGDYVFYTNRIIDINTPYKHDSRPLQRVMSVVASGESWRDIKAMERPINGEFNAGPIAFFGDGRSIMARFFANPIIPDMNVRTNNNANLYIIAPTSSGMTDVTLWNSSYSDLVNYSITAPFLSPDKQTLFYASNMPGGYGGYDIYYSRLNSNGTWSAPVNCGEEINTYADELYPTLGPGGSLFFASNGRAGMGGLDIYIAHIGKGYTFGHAENMGYPINSGANDFYLYAQSNDKVFIASNRDGGKGENDIYSFVYDFTQPRPKRAPRVLIPQADTSEMTEVTTIAEQNDVDTAQYDTVDSAVDEVVAVPVRIEIVDKRKRPVGHVDVTLTNTESGEVRQVRTNAKGVATIDSVDLYIEYTLTANKPGFGSVAIKFTIPSPQDVVARLTMNELLLNRDVRISGLYYDDEQWALKSAGERALSELATHLKSNPKLCVEIKSYTNEHNDPEADLQLAQQRARTIYNYLAHQGIEESRLASIGVGSFTGSVKAKSYTTYRLFKEGQRDVEASVQRRKALEEQRAQAAAAKRAQAEQQKQALTDKRTAAQREWQKIAAANRAKAQSATTNRATKPAAKRKSAAKPKPKAKAQPTVTYSKMEVKRRNNEE